MPAHSIVREISPAKVNLFLGITGPRGDGFHDLVSVVSKVDFSDELEIEIDPAKKEDSISLIKGSIDVPVDGSNLILQAIALFRSLYSFTGGAVVHLRKRIPVGAGLGGGSSNAVATLRGLNRCLGEPLGREILEEASTRLGSDCRLFWENEPVIMTGRGESIKPFTEGLALKGKKILLFKPDFPVDTAWAYQQMRKKPEHYISAEQAKEKIDAARGSLEALCSNNFEPIIFKKYLIMQVLGQHLMLKFNKKLHMSGSGSACFLASCGSDPLISIQEEIKSILGKSTFVVETCLN